MGSKTHQGLTTNMPQAFVTRLKLWPWEDPSKCPFNPNLSKQCLFKGKNLSQHPCWQLHLRKNKNRCWERGCSLSFKTCIQIWLERSPVCFSRSITPNWCTCWSTASPLKPRSTKLSRFFKLISPRATKLKKMNVAKSDMGVCARFKVIFINIKNPNKKRKIMQKCIDSSQYKKILKNNLVFTLKNVLHDERRAHFFSSHPDEKHVKNVKNKTSFL